MTRTTLVTLAVLIAAAVIATQIGGRAGMGNGLVLLPPTSNIGEAWQRVISLFEHPILAERSYSLISTILCIQIVAINT